MSALLQRFRRAFWTIIPIVFASGSLLPSDSFAQFPCTLDSVPGPTVPADTTATLRLNCGGAARFAASLPFGVEFDTKSGVSRLYRYPSSVPPLAAGTSKIFRAYQCVAGIGAVNEATEFCSQPTAQAVEIAQAYTISWINPAAPTFTCALAASPTSLTLGTNTASTLTATCSRAGAPTIARGAVGELIEYVWTGLGAPASPTSSATATIPASAFTASNSAQPYTVKLRYTAPGLLGPIESPAVSASIGVLAAPPTPTFSCSLTANPTSVILGASAAATLNASCVRTGAATLARGVAGETIEYIWTGAGAPTAATAASSVNLPASAFTAPAAAQPYSVKVRYNAPGLPSPVESPVATANIAVVAATTNPVFVCSVVANPTTMIIGGNTPATLTASCTGDGLPLRPRLNGAIEYVWTGPGAPASTTDITATIPASFFATVSAAQTYSVRLKYTALGATASTFSNEATASIAVRNTNDPVFTCQVTANPNSVKLGAATPVTLTSSCQRAGSASLRVATETIEYIWSGLGAPASTTDITTTIPASAFATASTGQSYSVRLKYTAPGATTSIFSNEATVSIPVTLEPTPVLACTLSADTKETFVENQRIKLSSNCTRDGAPLAAKSAETISYEWLSKDTAVAPAISSALSPSAKSSITLPQNYFLRTGTAQFAVRAKIGNGSFAGGNASSAEAQTSVLVIDPPTPRDTRRLVCNATAFPERATRDRVTQLSMKCGVTVNGAAVVLAGDESLTYFWTADGNAYPQPSPANAAIVNFAASTFPGVNRYSYTATATLTSPSKNTLQSVKSATIEIVAGSVERIDVITPVEQRVASPGKPLTLALRVLSSEGKPVSGKVINWALSPDPSSRAKRTNAIAAAVSCDPLDSPASSASRATDANGETSIVFTPGCGSGARQLQLSLAGSPEVSISVLVAGPDQAATLLTQLSAPKIIVVNPAVKSEIKIFVANTAGEKVPGAKVSWEFSPRTAGTADAQSTSEDDGFAASNITLNEGVPEARLLVCIVGRASTCAPIVVRSAKAAVSEPAAKLTKPLVQQSLVAPRLQLLQTRDRMQQLRQEGAGGFYNGLSVTAPGGRAPVGGASSESGAADGKATGTKDFGMFIVGDLEIYKRTGDVQADRYELRTNGLTFGADYRLRKSVVFGAAISGLRARTGFEDNRTQTATGLSGSLFAQWLPTDNWYVNAALNTGKNRFKMQRFADDSILSASTRGNQIAGQIESGYMFDSQGFKITPYARYEYVRATIDPFEETGGNGAIAVGAQRVRATAFAGGVTADRPFSTRSGVWIPSVKLEFVMESQNQSDAFAQLVNGTPVLVPVVGEFIDKNYGSVAFNLQWLTGIGAQPISTFIGYERTFGKSNVKIDRFSAGIKLAL